MKIYRYRSGAHQNSEISLLTFPYYLTLTSSRKCRTAHQLNLDVVQPVRYYNFISNRILPLQCNLHTYYLISRYFKIYCAKSTDFFRFGSFCESFIWTAQLFDTRPGDSCRLQKHKLDLLPRRRIKWMAEMFETLRMHTIKAGLGDACNAKSSATKHFNDFPR